MQVGSMNLFPLESAINRLAGYYLSADLSVYSTKRGPMPIKMMGSKSYGAYHRNFTLNSVSYTHDYLKTLVSKNSALHGDFIGHTSPKASATVVADSKIPNRSHASSVGHGIGGRGFVIAQVSVHDGEEHLLFGSKPAIHLNEVSCKDEMQRLAMSKPGTKFVALKITSSVVSGGVQWD